MCEIEQGCSREPLHHPLPPADNLKTKGSSNMPTRTEKANAYLLKLQADRAAALAASEEKLREAMLIKAREDGFREAMEIFQLTVTSNDTEEQPVNDSEEEPAKTQRARRRDIRQLIIKELSFSGKSMTKHQIAKAINYIPEGTEAALRRLEAAGIVQNQDGYWEVVVVPTIQSNGHGTKKHKSHTARESFSVAGRPATNGTLGTP
jgi:hypothetical protein